MLSYPGLGLIPANPKPTYKERTQRITTRDLAGVLPPISSNGRVAGNSLVLPCQSAEVILLLHASYGQGEDHLIIIGAHCLFYTEGWLEKAARLEIIQALKSLYNHQSHSFPPSPLDRIGHGPNSNCFTLIFKIRITFYG